MLRRTNHKCEENSNCYVADIMFCDDCTGLGILVLKAKLDITLEDLQKGPVFLSFAYRGTFFWLAVPGDSKSSSGQISVENNSLLASAFHCFKAPVVYYYLNPGEK